MRTWVQRFPGRLEHELAEFAERDLQFELDKSELEQQGRVVLHGTLPYGGEEIRLDVRYPDLYPYLRPEVVAPELELGRHQDPYDKNLCLLDASTRDWDCDESAASLVAHRVPYLLSLLAPGAERELLTAEVPQGEPASVRFPSNPGTVVFVPAGALALPETASAGSGRLAFSPLEPPAPGVRAMLAELVERRPNGKTKALAKADEELAGRFGGERVPFRWVRLSEAPPENSVEAVLEAAGPGFDSVSWRAVPGGRIAVAAVVFREEVVQGSYGDAWLFAVRFRRDDSREETRYLVRGQPLSRETLEERLPGDVSLGSSTVSLVGLGSVGAGVALELARAGLGVLRGMDGDSVEAGTTVRWPLGQGAAGRWKTGALAQRIARDYPYTSFEPFLHRLGQSAHTRTARQRSEFDLLDAFLDDADLLVEATAEIGVQHALSDLAAERGLAQLYASTTEGARGGLVARVLPGVTGCWLCLQHHLEDGSIPPPPRDEASTVQPRGCGTTTFVGARFDIAPVIAQAVRLAACVLSGGWREEAKHEGDRGDVFVLSLPEDRCSPPCWSTHSLTPHPACESCAER